MTITFGPLESTNDYATGVHRRALRSEGFAGAGVFGTHRRRIRSFGTAIAGAIDTDPEIPALGFHFRTIRSGGTAYSGAYAEGEHRRRIRSFGFGSGTHGATYDSAGHHHRRIRSRGNTYDPGSVGHGLLVAPPFFISGFGSQWFAFANDALVSGAGIAPLPTQVVRERAAFARSAKGLFDGTLTAADAIALGDDPIWTVFGLLEDLVLFNAAGEGDSLAIGRALERLVLSGVVQNVPEAIARLLDGLVLRELVDAYHHGQVADTLLTSAVIDSLYFAFAQALDRVLLSAEASGTYSLTVLVDERVVLGAELSHEAEAVALIRDAVGFAMSLSFDNGHYIAWVMNTASKGLSRYTNYPFNSFGRIGGRYVGCAADGLHWLDGDTDNGEAIHARIRLGMDAMGTRRAKRIPEAFIGYTSDGTLLLRVIQTNEVTGRREEAIYRLPVRPAESLRENRFKLGRGLKAVDFDFVIENVDGADFDLSSIEFRPIILDRRTRG